MRATACGRAIPPPQHSSRTANGTSQKKKRKKKEGNKTRRSIQTLFGPVWRAVAFGSRSVRGTTTVQEISNGEPGNFAGEPQGRRWRDGESLFFFRFAADAVSGGGKVLRWASCWMRSDAVWRLLQWNQIKLHALWMLRKACDKQPIITLITSYSLKHRLFFKAADSTHTHKQRSSDDGRDS